MIRNRLARVALVGLVSIAAPSIALAQTAPSLGSAQSFAVLAGSTVTNTGPTVVTGNVGLSPGTSVTGFPPGLVVSGTIHAANATSLAAQTSLTAAYTNLDGQSCTQILTGQDLGGMTLVPGVYCFGSSAQLTGTLTLNAQGNANAVFIFKMGSTLTTASGSSVVLINSGAACNVFWRVGSSATLGTTTSFAGNILAQASITLNTGAVVAGRALARIGAVTLDSNTVTAATCGVLPPGCPAITLIPPTLANGTVGVAYSQTITASGGTAPYTFTVASGALPAGLTLTSAGVLSGTPTTNGTFAFTIRGTDAALCFGETSYSVTITTPVPTLPQIFVLLLVLGLTAVGYLRLRQRARA